MIRVSSNGTGLRSQLKGFDRSVDGFAESVSIGERLMSDVMSLEVTPDGFDTFQLPRIFGQPCDRAPVSRGSACRLREFAGVDRAIVRDQHQGPGAC